MPTFSSHFQDIPSAGIGNQSIVTNNQPSKTRLFDKIGNELANTAKTVTTAIAKKKAQDIVASAETNLVNSFNQKPAIKDHPIVADSSKFFNKINTSMVQGTITRNAARLAVATEVKKRIQEAPLFGDKIRREASRILGFDPLMVDNKGFFGQFPTKTVNTKENTMLQKAQQLSSFTGRTVQEEFSNLAKIDVLDNENKLALAEKTHGTLTANAWLEGYMRNTTKQDFYSLSSALLADQKQGKVDSTVINSTLDSVLQQRLLDLRTKYTGNINSKEYIQAIKDKQNEFDGYKTWVKNQGADTLNQIKLKELSTARELLINKDFNNFITAKAIDPNLTASMIKIIANDPNGWKGVKDKLQGLPSFSKFINLFSSTEQAKNFVGVASKLQNDAPMTQEEKSTVPAVATVLKDSPDIIAALNRNGYKILPLSIVANKHPIAVSNQKDIAFLKQSFKSDLPEMIKNLENIKLQNPTIALSVDSTGTLNVSNEGLLGFSSRDLVNNINNTFKAALDNGWGSIVGMTKKEYINGLTTAITATNSKAANVLDTSSINDMISSLQNHNDIVNSAGSLGSSVTIPRDLQIRYDSLQKVYPSLLPKSIEKFNNLTKDRNIRFKDLNQVKEVFNNKNTQQNNLPSISSDMDISKLTKQEILTLEEYKKNNPADYAIQLKRAKGIK